MIIQNTLQQDGFFLINKFKDFGFVKVEQFIDEQSISTISQYFENKIKRGEWLPKEKLSPNDSSKFSYYADPLVETILKEYLPIVEEHTRLNLEPTYSFSRVYQVGEELQPHTDRPSCEISVTVNVACAGNPWPIFMQYQDNDPVKLILSAGDAVIYKGCETMHWRRKRQDQVNVQFMLHYVNKNGPHSEYKFDKRESLALDSLARRS